MQVFRNLELGGSPNELVGFIGDIERSLTQDWRRNSEPREASCKHWLCLTALSAKQRETSPQEYVNHLAWAETILRSD